jgi:hypothetical protein
MGSTAPAHVGDAEQEAINGDYNNISIYPFFDTI